MNTIIDILKQVAEESGIKRVYHGPRFEMAQLLNLDATADIVSQPALFILQDFRERVAGMRHIAELDMLITVHGESIDVPNESRQDVYKNILYPLYETFMRNLRHNPNVTNIGEYTKIDRPKVSNALDAANNSNVTVYNQLLDGIELLMNPTFYITC